MVCLHSPPLPPTSPAPQLLPVEERCRMGAPDKQTPNALGMGAQSILDVSFSLGKDKPVANEKAGPPEGFRQGSLTGLSRPMGSGGPAGPRWSKICRAAASSALANNCLHCFPRGLHCHDFPNTRSFQTREPDTLGDPGLNITGTTCLNDYYIFYVNLDSFSLVHDHHA